MSLKTLIAAVDAKLVALKNKDTPIAGTVFDHVWIGMPEKIPMGAKNVAIVEAASLPTFYYTTCPETTMYDADIYITIMCKGHVEDANNEVYEITDLILEDLLKDQKTSNNCIGSTIEEVVFGDILRESKNLVAAGRITLRCNL